MDAFRDRIAVITGASSGIGKAIALGVADRGATVCLVGRQQKPLEAVAESARATAQRVLTYCADLTLDSDIEQLKASLQRDCQHIDVLVHGAGVVFLGPLEHAPVEEFDMQYRVNVRAPYLLTQALLPMLRLRRGQIVFVNSSVGLNTRANVSQYSATKHALRAIADSLRDEVNADGLRVLSVYPGRTATPGQAAIHKIEGKEYHPERLMQPEDVAAVVINTLSLERTAEVTNISIRPSRKT